ncbi:acyl-CoA thioesterase [Oceanobacillus iheyensis]|uniref:acyl-CoA thioesterase n=1 Tax=Oceanobacillus iheyensis TaxID=182710 RepID=UPI003630AA31
MKSIEYIDDFSSWAEEFEFYIPINIRFSETDMYGHMNNVSPFIYFEEARIAYLQSLGLFNDFTNKDEGIIVADLQCDYLKQLFFGDQVNVHVKTQEVGNSSFDVHYMVTKGNFDVVLTARGRLVYIDANLGKSKPLTEDMKEKLISRNFIKTQVKPTPL